MTNDKLLFLDRILPAEFGRNGRVFDVYLSHLCVLKGLTRRFDALHLNFAYFLAIVGCY